MTRDELINFGEMFLDVNRDSKNSNTYEFIETALKLLKQEPCKTAIDKEQVFDILRRHHHEAGRDVDGDIVPGDYTEDIYDEIKTLPPLSPDTLADLLMEERIRGELKQDLTYSKDIIDGVKCKLTVEIIDRRPCRCGAELREVWRE